MTTRFGTFGRAVAITLTVGVAFGLAGCGDEAPSGAGYASKDNTVKAGDAALSRDNLISTTYDAAMKAGSAHMAMTMKGAASSSAQGDVSYDGGKAAMRMTMSIPQLGNGEIEMRYVDQVIYLQIPGMTPAGKFVVIDPSDQSSPMAKSFEGLSQQMDPLRSVKTMESSVNKVVRVGQGEVEGASVDHYRVTVDAAKMMKKLEQSVRAEMPRSITYDMWLDEKNLIRKMTFGAAGTSVEMLLSKWGQDVKVQRPEARDIMKAPAA